MAYFRDRSPAPDPQRLAAIRKKIGRSFSWHVRKKKILRLLPFCILLAAGLALLTAILYGHTHDSVG